MRLSEKDRQLLVSLYETPQWAAFRRNFLEERQLELAQLAPFSPDLAQLAETRGKIVELKGIEVEMRKLHDSDGKKKKS